MFSLYNIFPVMQNSQQQSYASAGARHGPGPVARLITATDSAGNGSMPFTAPAMA
ncbi:hypothetical protein Acr_00g0006240 [Actinidia rufa]|uniref:Uncharacterized protein n=1 Tax=Actinidia rufa TaxID=165716 RepID=A0A7J0D7Y9_9ERIC|nr:hypothetical protein Acr_00g0006240 [Actinidia rufa]